MQGLVVVHVDLIVEEIQNINYVKCVKVTGAGNIGQHHRVKAEFVH